MRSEVIDRILSVEDEAEKIKAKAEEEARSIVLDAQSEASRRIKEASDAERRRADETVSQASGMLDAQLRELEEKTRQLTAKPAEVDMDKAQEAARRIVRLVCSVPFASKE